MSSVAMDVEPLDFESEDDGTMELILSSGEKFKVRRDVGESMSELMAEVLNRIYPTTTATTTTTIKIDHIKPHILSLIISYMNHHFNNPAAPIATPLVSTDIKEWASEWDVEFMNIDQATMFQLMLSANYMAVKPLVELISAKLASMIMGKSTKEIHDTFNITAPESLTDEQEESIDNLMESIGVKVWK